MRLLITPSNPAYTFVLLDTETGTVNRIASVPEESDHGANDRWPAHRPYGITWDARGVYVANRRNLCVYTHGLEYRYSIPNVLGENPHQLAISDGELICCAADRDALMLIDVEGRGVRVFSLLAMGFGHIREPADTLHLNSVIVHRGKLYLCLHHHGQRRSQILVIDRATMRRERIIDTPAYAAHNIFLRDGLIGTLDTGGTRRLAIGDIQIDLGVPEGHFLRGMAATANRFAVAHFPQRQRRYRGSGNATIKVLEGGRIIGTHVLDDIGAINDMRLLCEYDYCHHNDYRLCL